MQTKLLIGLGNPDPNLKMTRHNVGHMLVDEFANITKKGWVLKKTSVYMNSSGKFVKEEVGKGQLKLENLYIAHDDLDLKLGEYKIQFAKGPKDNNGINSVEEELGSKEFWRIRIGIDNRLSENRTAGEIYVLENFDQSEVQVLNVVLKSICKKLVTI